MTEPRPRTESELIEFVRSIEARAPDALHHEVQALVSSRRTIASRAGRSSTSTAGRGLVTVAAVAAAVVLVIALSGGGGGGGGAPTLSLRQASALTLRAATVPAPSQSASNSTQLAVAVDGVSFPYWEDRFGWRSTGARSDRVGGRMVTTVFYTDGHHHRIGYAIVAGVPPRLSGGVIAWRGKEPYRLSSEHSAQVVTWLRNGHLCVMSGRGVDGATLLQLASWGERSSPVPS